MVRPPLPWRTPSLAEKAVRRTLGALGLVMTSALVCWAQDSDQTRYYFDVRLGETNPAVAARDVKGFSLGVNLGLHTGAELAGDWYELKLKAPGYGQIGEWGIFALAPVA